jgi:Protein of unknown function (DUF1493)
MEGVDAEEFIDRYTAEFSVDTNDLNTHWNCYFPSDSASPIVIVGWGIAVAAVRVVCHYLLPKGPNWICWIIAFTIPTIALYVWGSVMNRPHDNEITIQQLVEAAKSGRLELHPVSRKPEVTTKSVIS